MLEEYKDILASIAGFMAIGHMLSGTLICKKIYQNRSTENIPPFPFIGGFVIAILFNQHARLIKDDAIGLVNFTGIGINLCYITFYLIFSRPEERTQLFKATKIGAAVLAVLLGYVRVENPEVVAVRFGVIVAGTIIVLLALPLFSIGKIIRTKDASQLPFPLALSGFCIGSSWTLYGIAAHQPFIVGQNAIVVTLTGIQLLLCLIYPGPTKLKAS